MSIHHPEAATIAFRTFYWNIRFNDKTVISLSDMESVFQSVYTNSTFPPVALDFSHIDGIDFDALEYVAQTAASDPCHPMAVLAEQGSIGEKYAHLIEQLSENTSFYQVFNSIVTAEMWLKRFIVPE